ncbi:MAG: ion transporter [Planctomycetota bacterium]
MNSEQSEHNGERHGWRETLRVIIFEADTPLGKTFDLILMLAIIASVFAVAFETVESVAADYGRELRIVEWVFTILFTIEYVLRLISVRKPGEYARSFFGVVDLLSFLPTYLAAFIPGAQTLLVVRALRLIRVFRILKLARFVSEGGQLLLAVKNSLPKVSVFLVAVLTTVIIVGTIMYLVEGPENGFTSIPQSVYWAIVTMSTVGYGDLAPATPLGKTLASIVMIIGYGVLAVPTGIVTAEIGRADRTKKISTKACADCSLGGHDPDAEFCKRCGARL